MVLRLCICVLILIIFNVNYSDGHGKLMDPVNRSSAWRRHFDTPKNYNDNELFCGGYGVS